MGKEHNYRLHLNWTGNLGTGTLTYRGYTRDHTISAEGKPQILASSDPSFRGNPERYNPEEMLMTSAASCHMLSYLHLCAVHHIVVVEYSDNPTGKMLESAAGNGRFEEITLNPVIVVAEKSMLAKAYELHHDANKLCFIANSLNFPVKHNPTITALN
jgi:organic hydroperoxide reductase OsmC/OhrA